MNYERHLFDVAKVCALDPWAPPRELALTDVLLKKRTKAGTIVVGRAGNLTTAGTWDPPGSEARISEGMAVMEAARRSDKEDDFQKGRVPELNFHVTSSSQFLGSILGPGYLKAKAQWKSENMVNCKVQNVTYEKIQHDFVTNLVTSEPLSWTPDVKVLELFGWPTAYGLKGRTRSLWIVTEIRSCTKIVIAANWSQDLEGEISADVFGEGGVGAGGVGAGGAEVRVTRTKTGNWEVTAPVVDGNLQPMAFAFKAVRLEYDGSGTKLVHVQDSVGSKPLDRRAASPDLFDPDEDPVYHMGGLFAEPPDASHDRSPLEALVPLLNIAEFQSC